MQVTLSSEQIDRIIEALAKSYISQKDQYLINYLKTIKSDRLSSTEVNLDEIPF